MTIMASSLLRRGSNVRYINPLCEVFTGEKSNVSTRRRTSARCMSISRTSLPFFRTSINFSALASFNSLKTHRNSLLTMSLQFALVFFCDLISYFPRKEAKLFYFEGPPETREG